MCRELHPKALPCRKVLSDYARLDTDAAGGLGCHLYGFFRVSVTPSNTLEEMPRLERFTVCGLLWPVSSIFFHSAAAARVQVSQLPQPGVIKVVLIFGTLGSPFYLSLIKVGSSLWSLSFMWEWEIASGIGRACMTED